MKILLLQYYRVNINTNLDACNIHIQNLNCSFKIKLETEDGARKWVQDYNNATLVTMVFLKWGGVKMYFRCHYKE